MDAAFGFGGGFQIKVLGVPLQNARSRVETQTKLCLQMVNATGNKTSLWTHLRLPEQLVTKEKLRKSQNVVDYSLIPLNKVLDLQAVIICASDPKKDVQICSGCQQRELKRSKKKSESASSSSDVKMEDVSLFNGLDTNAMAENDSGKIVLFNCGSYVDFSSGDTILPTRITCYCRHHNEKTGFCVYFIARDHNSNVIATGISPPILITDDHKGTKAKGLKRSRADELAENMIPEMPSPTSPPNTVLRPQSDFQDDIIAQFIPALLASESNAPLFENFGIRKEDPEFRRSKKQFQSPPPQSVFSSSSSASSSSPAPPSAVINRIIPGEGPIQGGVEITILGENIHNGLIAVFGDLDAITTQVWGTSTMICILPPSSTPGPVPVTLKAVAGFNANPVIPDIPVTFMYKDDLDRSLMELALQVVGLRMTGSLDSARNIAMRIVNETAQETMNDSALTFNELKRNQLETAVLNALFSLEEHTDELNDAQQVVLTSLLDMTFHSSNGLNMLHIACLAGMTTLVKYLISLDCDMDPRDKNGFTPLMFAILSRNHTTVDILLQAGASHLLTSKNGVSCFALAKKNGAAEYDVFLKALDAVGDACLGGYEDGAEFDDVVASSFPVAAGVGAGIVPDISSSNNSGLTRRLSCPNVFSVPAVPEFKSVIDTSLPTQAKKGLGTAMTAKLVEELTNSLPPPPPPPPAADKLKKGRSSKGIAEANSIRWTNPDEELKNIMNGFKMFSFLGPLVHTMANPLVVQRVDVNYLFNNSLAAADFPTKSGGVSSREAKKQQQKKLDQTVSVVPFSGFGDEDHCCESWNNGLGTTHQASCSKAIQLKKNERKRKRKERALWLFWLPLFTLALMLLLFWVMLSEEEMGALLDRFLTWNDGVVSKVKDTYKVLQKDSKNLVFEFLNTGFGQL
ncbi:hypothetical protein BDR26DRAFT_860949 [Obelidium mucronatum]|nr:hypothetical protein BDR26DRAFT_860949 [Obelidium mucronatum]